jgi:uncharacterized protein
MSGRRAGWLLAAALLGASAAGAADVPYLSGRVVDEAAILSPAVRERVAAAAKAHEDATTNQIAVLTVATIAPESIEDYAVRVYQAWKLGQAGRDNGVLVVVVPRDRKLRIEVGYGLEPALTDTVAGGIIRDVMTPRFKAGDFDGGVSAGVDAIVAVLEGRGGPSAPAEPPAVARSRGGDFFEAPPLPWYGRLLLGAFVFGILGLFTFLGIVTPGMGWFLYFFLIPFWAIFPVMVVGGRGALAVLATHLVGFPIAKLALKRQGWYEKATRDLKLKGRARIGGFAVATGGGGWSSGSSSSGSSSGGGFSGGGGSSGGGGASGSW